MQTGIPISYKKALDELLLQIPGVYPGQMMGNPIWLMEGKKFSGLYEHGFSLKLPHHRIEQLIRENSSYVRYTFRNRVYREWIMIPFPHDGKFDSIESLFYESIQYILDLKG